jgi:hypothetical protein
MEYYICSNVLRTIRETNQCDQGQGEMLREFMTNSIIKKPFTTSKSEDNDVQHSNPIRNCWTKILWYLWKHMNDENCYDPDNGDPRNVFNKEPEMFPQSAEGEKSKTLFYTTALEVYCSSMIQHFFCGLSSVTCNSEEITLYTAEGKNCLYILFIKIVD